MDKESKQKNSDLIRTLAQDLRRRRDSFRIFAGFDGFVDEIIRVVKQRSGPDSYIPMKSMKEFGSFVTAAANRSANVEFVPEMIKCGGNGPIFAGAAASLGYHVRYVGAVGSDAIHPVFQEMPGDIEFTGICEPAGTQALEFSDGKLICSKLESLNDIDWAHVSRIISPEELLNAFMQADLIAFMNWTLVINCNDLWQGILEHVTAGHEQQLKGKPLFIDIADPKKRDPGDIFRAFDLIRAFSEVFDVSLGLNLSEAETLSSLLGFSGQKPGPEDYAQYIFDALSPACVVVHPERSACAVNRHGTACTQGPYTDSPVLTTGAGDNFNAGFAAGLLMKKSLEECLILAAALSGFYVRNAKSPSPAEYTGFLEKWADNEV